MYYLAPYKDSEVFDHHIKGLMKAGYEGNPSNYYKLIKENRLTGQEIQELLFGKTIAGNIYKIPWSISTNKEGKIEYINPFFGPGIHKGKSWVEGDALCRQYESLYDGMKDCAEIYKNPEGDNETGSEYLMLTDYGISPFSIKQ